MGKGGKKFQPIIEWWGVSREESKVIYFVLWMDLFHLWNWLIKSNFKNHIYAKVRVKEKKKNENLEEEKK